MTLSFWFNQPRVGMQCSESWEKEFGWDCMLGKLCRLAKRCQRASTTRRHERPSGCNRPTRIRLVFLVNYMLNR